VIQGLTSYTTLYSHLNSNNKSVLVTLPFQLLSTLASIVEMSSRSLRSGKPSDGAMRYSPFEDDHGRMHEPQDNSRDYHPDNAASDDEDEGPIPSLLSSKPRVIAPSVSIPRRRVSNQEDVVCHIEILTFHN